MVPVTAQCHIVSRPGLERKISMRTSKEELIQRGILLPGEAGVATFPQDPRAASPRLNLNLQLPQLSVVSKSGRWRARKCWLVWP